MTIFDLSTIVLTIHIVLLTGSLIGVSILSVLAAAGRTVRVGIRLSILASSLIGIGAGGLLLLAAPTPASCIKLTAFLVAFAVLYLYVEAQTRRAIRSAHQNA